MRSLLKLQLAALLILCLAFAIELADLSATKFANGVLGLYFDMAVLLVLTIGTGYLARRTYLRLKGQSAPKAEDHEHPVSHG